MADVIDTIAEGLKQSFLMAYEVWWALVLGFAISALVQAWVPRQRMVIFAVLFTISRRRDSRSSMRSARPPRASPASRR